MKISIYITSYNQEQFLTGAIESVLSQTMKPFEIIIVDDFSSDGSRDLINSYRNKYPELIKTIFQPYNKGVTQCRIDALNLTSGDYVTYLDGDDLYLEQKLEEEAELIKKFDADIAFSNYYRLHEIERGYDSIWLSNKAQVPPIGDMSYEVFLRKFPNNSLFRCELINRKLLARTGLYDRGLKIYEDFEFKIRLSNNGRIAFTLVPLHVYRDNPGGLSKSRFELHLESFEYIYKKHIADFRARFPDRIKEIESRYDFFFNQFDGQPSHPMQVKIFPMERLKRFIMKIF